MKVVFNSWQLIAVSVMMLFVTSCEKIMEKIQVRTILWEEKVIF